MTSNKGVCSHACMLGSRCCIWLCLWRLTVAISLYHFPSYFETSFLLNTGHSLALGHTGTLSFYMGARVQAQIFMFMWQALFPLSASPGPLLTFESTHTLWIVEGGFYTSYWQDMTLLTGANCGFQSGSHRNRTGQSPIFSLTRSICIVFIHSKQLDTS